MFSTLRITSALRGLTRVSGHCSPRKLFEDVEHVLEFLGLSKAAVSEDELNMFVENMNMYVWS